MLTVQEAAERKGVTDVRVYQWLAEGRLTKHGKYGRTLVAVAELDALQELRRGPKPKAEDAPGSDGKVVVKKKGAAKKGGAK